MLLRDFVVLLSSWSNADEEVVVRKSRRLHGVRIGIGIGVAVGATALLLVGSVAHAQVVAPVAAPIVVPEITVEEGEDTLHDAVEAANPGDVLVLEPGLYVLTHTVVIDKDLTIRGETGKPEDVHIAGAPADEFDFQPDQFPDPLDWGHLLFVTDDVENVTFRGFTIKNAPEIEAITEDFCEANYGLNHSECMGDAIHSAGATHVVVRDVEASLNAGNGIWIDGAETASLKNIVGANNGAFGIDVDSAEDLSIRDSTFIANQVSGIEASGESHALADLHREDYTARASIKDVVAKGNGEIGIEVERFNRVKVEDIKCLDNREDGFDADRVSELQMKDSEFINNLDDGVELFPVDIADPAEQPEDFPGSTKLDLDDLEFSGNVGEDLVFAPTEN
jgi:nitrous oxidase accessory protein NosD